MRIGLLFILLLNKGFTYAQVIDESKREAFTFTYEHISLIDKEHKTYKQIEDSALSVPAGQSRSGELYRQASQVNDNCVTAIPLVINGGDYTYSNAGATGSGTDPVPSTWSSCTGGPSNNVLHTVWFKFVVLAGPKNITVSSTGNTVNRTILRANYAVYSGTCGALTLIGSSGTGSYGNIDSKRISLTNLAAGTYYIMTDGVCSNTGTFAIRVDETPSSLNSLWYPVSNFPTLLPGVPLTTKGQWGTYAADGTEASTSCVSGLQYSDWYRFIYDTLLVSGLHVTDQAAQAAFTVVLYDASGREIVCNRYGANIPYASFTWDLSAQGNIPVHMPNIGFRELGLTQGATYYVRVSNSSPTRYNVNNLNQTYTIQLGNYIPLADTYLNVIGNVVTPDPFHSWLTGQTNLRASQSMLSEPESGNSGIIIENSMIYKFNTGNTSTVKINLQNISYYSFSGLEGQLAVLTDKKNGMVRASGTFTGSSYSLMVSGLSAYTDYWVLIDGGGSYAGCRLSYDLSVTSISALPIDLLDFTVRNNGGKAFISWKTASEVNNDYFTIERSADGVNFSFVATVTGAGHSNTLLEYLYTDASPLKGNSYYRLKQTDFDGETSFSEIRQFFLNSGPDKLYPTFLKESDFVYRTEWEGEAKVKLYNNTGTKVKEISQYLSKGENDLRLSCSALPGGIYFVIIERNGNTSMYKAVIAR